MSDKRVHVAVGVIRRSGSSFTGEEILISRRAAHQHQGDCWEFPGGKVEAGESVQEALRRELHEELGITIDLDSDALFPLIQITHNYPEKKVLLDVWSVRAFSGIPSGREGQKVRWVDLKALPEYTFPSANRPIISACQLPETLAITPELDSLPTVFAYLEHLRQSAIKMVVLRQKHWSPHAYRQLAREVLKHKLVGDMQVLLHGDPDDFWPEFDCGVHMPAQIALQKKHRFGNSLGLGMSCHSEAELAHAEHLGLGYATLSPVKQTISHPQAEPIGWQCFSQWVKPSKVPVYALGGLRRSDLNGARQAGAQGIAGISGLAPEIRITT